MESEVVRFANMNVVSGQKVAFQKSGLMRAILMGALFLTVSCGTLTVHAFTAADADKIFEAHTITFYQVTNGVAVRMALLYLLSGGTARLDGE